MKLAKGVRLKIIGRVQGVNFRNMVFSKAQELKLTGRVRNLDDGSVEIVACGFVGDLKKLISWIKGSPGLSKVLGIEEKWREVKEKFADFEIRKERGFIGEQVRAVGNLGRAILHKV